jgi:hypothetical protein
MSKPESFLSIRLSLSTCNNSRNAILSYSHAKQLLFFHQSIVYGHPAFDAAQYGNC